jgi:hypothetical protein
VQAANRREHATAARLLRAEIRRLEEAHGRDDSRLLLPLTWLCGSLCQGSEADRRAAIPILVRTVDLYRHHHVPTDTPAAMIRLLNLQSGNHLALAQLANGRATAARGRNDNAAAQREETRARESWENARLVFVRQLELFAEGRPARNSLEHAECLTRLAAVETRLRRPNAEVEGHYRAAIRILERHPARLNGTALEDQQGRALVGENGQYLVILLRAYSEFLDSIGRRQDATAARERANRIAALPARR